MSEINRSSVAYLSNIQDIKTDNILDDCKFLSHILDPKALEILKRHATPASEHGWDNTKYRLSFLQRDIFKNAALSCGRDNMSWGIMIKNGEKIVVCKCVQTHCPSFKECRPDFSSDELDIFQKNEEEKFRINNINNPLFFHPLATSDYSDEVPDVMKKNTSDEQTALAMILEPELVPVHMESIAQMDSEQILIEKTANLKVSAANIVKVDGRPVEDTVSVLVRGDFDTTDDSLDVQKEKNDIITKYSDTTGEIVFQCDCQAERLIRAVSFDDFRDVDQSEFIQAPISQRTIINAGPGTGKTWSLIERIIHMASSSSNDEVDDEPLSDTVQVICFSNAAVGVVENRLKLAIEEGRLEGGRQKPNVRTLDSFASCIIHWAREHQDAHKILPKGFSWGDSDYDKAINTAREAISKYKGIFDSCRHFIIDEVQDIVGCRAEFVLEILKALPEECGFSLLGDACQAIYDYQADNHPNMMNSEEFYAQLFASYTSAIYLKFSKNYRQQNPLPQQFSIYRDAILTGDIQACKNAFKQLRSETHVIEKEEFDLGKPNADFLNKLRKKGSIAFLTRNNGQSLRVSTWLRQKNINHQLFRETPIQHAGWIGRFFLSYDDDVIDKADFSKVFPEIFPDKKEYIEDYWNALINESNSGSRKRYKTADILRAIMTTKKWNTLLTPDDNINSEIVVSNIHRAKGREFDVVILVSEQASPDDIEKREEHRVNYTGFSRYKKEMHECLIAPQYTRKFKNENPRWYFKRKNSVPVKYLEIGLDGDLDDTFFASNKAIQAYIKEKLHPCDPLRLRKKEGCMLYEILPENEWARNVIGLTSIGFGEYYRKILIESLREAQNSPNWRVEPRQYLYANELFDVYVKEIVTYIKPYSPSTYPAAKKIGDLSVWLGFSVIGFANCNNNDSGHVGNAKKDNPLTRLEVQDSINDLVKHPLPEKRASSPHFEGKYRIPSHFEEIDLND